MEEKMSNTEIRRNLRLQIAAAYQCRKELENHPDARERFARDITECADRYVSLLRQNYTQPGQD